MTEDSTACDEAHGNRAAERDTRNLVAVFASPMARYLLAYGRDAGYRVTLVEPELDRAAEVSGDGVAVSATATGLDGDTDVVVTDHHRGELGPVLRDVLAQPVRWVGVMGNPHREGPHVVALRGLGVPDDEIARVHRPIGLNIGSRTPPEIAIATLAGLLADRNGKPGGFVF
ncbi:XdhC family protein [Haloechinothrix sp. LS1_15]|uniref:XdhC family protein n=1 Tax=Haloechinothrix sp. LS1_15 TaxID=2652248 RepID=UPI002945F784|nr:XdhC family protein [Haloechinothrix sp. LS1_15]MDV6012321.1 xanthine dehydrogenase [Haloechinothrix sp. LS1_15]